MPEFNIKYRPQTIGELDLASVREGLEKVLSSEHIPHAFLFCGPRGTGKTSAARIVAKAVNCLEKGKEFEPCNKCEQCVSITSGNNLDVLEIDAASNRGIDDIRDLREKIKLAPAKSKYKVYIIDEVHMLTIEAFNALLKTLEEPPAHAIFILCTTDWEKLPETIVSRCMRFNFKRANLKEITDKLKRIAKTEKIEIEDKALDDIAKASSGSFRDAQKIFEQASYSKANITAEDIEKILGNTVGINPEALLKLLADKKTKEALDEISRVVENGANLKIYCQNILELLRQGLLTSLGVSEKEQNQNTETVKILDQFKTSDFEKLINLFSQAGRDLKDALIPQLPLELAIVSYCLKEKQPEDNVKAEEAVVLETDQKQEIPQVIEDGEKQQFCPDIASVGPIQHRWQEILLGVRPKNHSVEALLRATRPISYVEDVLTLEVFYKFHKDQLETEKCRSIVEEVTSHLIGRPVKLKCILGQRPQKPVPNFELPQKEINTNEVTQEDLVKVAEEIFSGRIN
jgi:DNA polymerase III subunit gamma/tau